MDKHEELKAVVREVQRLIRAGRSREVGPVAQRGFDLLDLSPAVNAKHLPAGRALRMLQAAMLGIRGEV